MLPVALRSALPTDRLPKFIDGHPVASNYKFWILPLWAVILVPELWIMVLTAASVSNVKAPPVENMLKLLLALTFPRYAVEPENCK